MVKFCSVLNPLGSTAQTQSIQTAKIGSRVIDDRFRYLGADGVMLRVSPNG
jgi:hypothetical protein